MGRVAETDATDRKAQIEKANASELGRKLRQISERIAASGEKSFSRRELERELAHRRGGI